MHQIYVLDRLINKPIKLFADKIEDLRYWDKILYSEEEKDQKMIWIYLGYECETIKNWKMIEKLVGEKQDKFNTLEKKAKDLFNIFKTDFKQHFQTTVPVNARMNYAGDTAYFYFYDEERLNFTTFIRSFRDKIRLNFFLFQVWARDRIRLSDSNNDLYWVCWQKLCCKTYKSPLPTVENENIELQNLEYRWVEKLKGKCGKLKCCLNYERDIYMNEWEKFPRKWETFSHGWCKFSCNSFNIMTWEVVWRSTENEESIRINIKDI